MSMMIFNILFFLGIFLMFFFVLRGQDQLMKAMRNELAQTRAKLHLMEMRLANHLGEDISPAIATEELNLNLSHAKDQDDMPEDDMFLHMDPPKSK